MLAVSVCDLCCSCPVPRQMERIQQLKSRQVVKNLGLRKPSRVIRVNTSSQGLGFVEILEVTRVNQTNHTH